MLRLYKEKQEIVPSPTPIAGKANGEIQFDFLGNKIYFISLGCPRNLVDSEVMLGILLKAGYEVAQDLKEADYIIINTCGFLESSRAESSETIDNTFKEKKESAKLIVAGCMVQTHKQDLKDSFPKIDYFLGSGDVEAILQAVKSIDPGEAISNARSYLEAGEAPRQLSTPKHYAYLKIAEGCRKRCSYCIIPEIKGPLKSKSKEQILKEFALLLDQGVHEVILIAQDLGDYGKEKGFKKVDGLIDLLKSILAIDRPFWLRLLYLYPDEITEELVDVINGDRRICRYLDMPIQHVNDTILKAMRRTTSKEEITGIIKMLRQKISGITIRTSLIVGFPGETEEQFLELAEFIQKFPLDNIGIFKYSKEAKSHSSSLPDQISEKTKQQRYDRLMQMQQKILKKRNARWIGKKIDVVIEGYHPDSNLLMRGRHAGQCPEIDGMVILNDCRAVKAFGAIQKVEITGSSEYDLIGRVL